MARTTMDALVDLVRTFLRDDPAENQILGKHENSPDQCRFAVNQANDWVNSVPPLSSHLPEATPFRGQLIQAAALFLQKSLLMRLERDRLLIQDAGGINVTPEQLALLERRLPLDFNSLRQELHQTKASYALQLALSGAEGVSSVYDTTWEGEL